MKKRYFILMLSAIIALTGCNNTGISDDNSSETAGSTEAAKPESTDDNSVTTDKESAEQNTGLLSVTNDMFSNRDVEIGYDEETSARIVLSGNSAESDSKAVNIDGTTVTVKEEGTYIISGTLDDGMLIVNAEDTDKVRLVLNGVRISNSDCAAIYIANADKVFITTAADTENILSNGGEYVRIDDNNIDAAVYSKEDLTLNGEGSLTVSAAAGHGIVSKDDLVVTSGTYNVTAEKHGLFGKDSVRISNGSFTIKSGKDGIQSENTDDVDKGYVYIANGDFDITASGDGISAEAYLTIDGGKFNVTTGGGSASVTMKTDAMGFGKRGDFWSGSSSETDETEETVSVKGIKTDGTLTINGGNITTDTEDDALHANGNITVNGGKFTIKTGDDALHSDADVTIKDGEFDILYCYEGIEGQNITVEAGDFDISAYDDGFNAAGGADSSVFGGGFPGDRFGGASDSSITFNGGNVVIVSDGDCIDSNGSLTINGGKFDLTCNGNGNTALDCDGTYTDNGGDITTNDGSESNPGQMGGGGHGGMGGNGGFGGMGGHGGMRVPDDASIPDGMEIPNDAGFPDGMGDRGGMGVPGDTGDIKS